MLLTHPTSDNMDTILITYLSDEITCAQTHFLCQYLTSTLYLYLVIQTRCTLKSCTVCDDFL